MLKIYLAFLFFVTLVSSAAPSPRAWLYIYKTVGDLQIPLDVYVPPATPPQSGYPVLFVIHGGAYVFGHKQAAFTDQELNETMNRGWVLVSIDYRLAPGVLLPDMFEDIQDAYDFVRSNLTTTIPINPDLITVFGQSSGGGLAVICGYKLVPRPAAVISLYPAWTNWTTFHVKSPANPLIVADAKRLRTPVLSSYKPKSVADPIITLLIAAYEDGQFPWLMSTMDPKFPADKIMAFLREYSATENVDSEYPPTFLAHGLKDRLVPFEQSIQLADQFEKYKIPNELTLVPGADHAFDYNASYWPYISPAFKFAQRYMGGGNTKLNHE